ncbi:hypothetical protein [Ochrobactrum sp. CGA5]|uniref:hypothetical protein n=1 Tax=Ochrobactrum sp. CGA5 TaxID=2583453 RepID=UPI00111FD051|nr:hypothetical protein [Ochrobactrum sp. CGA5]
MTSDLIIRLSKLNAPDREADAEIDRSFGLLVDEYPLSGPMTDYPEPVGYVETKHYTASVDDAIALAERVLPVANVLIGWGQTDETKPWARIGVTPSHDATGFNLATALLIALLRAEEASK